MPSPFVQLPARVGPFEITGLLGEGGMGIVYSARTSSGDRVAIKTVPAVERTLLSTLRREIHALGRVSHPGVVRVLATGVDGGRPWYAMELLEGTTAAALRDSLWGDQLGLAKTHVSEGGTDSQRTVPIRGTHAPITFAVGRPRGPAAAGQLPRVLTIARRLLGTLAFLHGEGIVHRDLKPHNIFLRTGDQPVLVDFGLAVRSAGTIGREVVDEALDVVGTPAYMAPEQIRADLVDSRADLYAFGCVLYELLTGRPPFLGASAVIMEHHLSVEAAPPSAFVDGVAPPLDELLRRLLAKRPRDRLGHAEDAIAALDELGVPPERPLGPRPRAYVYRPALAGRDAALDELGRAARGALRGDGGCWLIAGESGMGKTFLAMEAARASTQLEVVAGTCAPVGTPLHPLQRLFDRVIDRCVAGGRAETDRLLGPRGKILAAHEPAFARLPGQHLYPEPPPLHGLAARDRLLGAVADTLAALADEQPVLLLLDDLQWADEVTLVFLSSLPDDWFARKRVLVLGTYRLEEARPVAALLERPYVRQVRVGKLDEGSVGALVCDMLAVDAPPPELIHLLASQSEGNPFFVAEYLRTATAEGLLRRGTAGHGVVTAGELGLPRTMRELVARRLDGLSPDARAIAAQAAVLGREFDPEVLRDAAGAAEAEALDALAELIARQVLETTDHGALRFVHDKLHEIAYERLPADALRARHRAAGEALERRHPEPERARVYAQLAHHFVAADDGPRAIEYLEKAGARALATAAYAEACDLHRKLLVRAPDESPRRRARWQRRLGEACFNLGDLAACEEASLAAMKLLGRPVPTSKLGWAGGLLRLVGTQALHRVGIGVGRRADPDGRDDLLEVGLAASTMAWRYFFVDDMVGLISMSLLSVNEIETATPPIRVAYPYAWLGYTAGLSRLHPLARYYFAQADAAARETGDTAGAHFANLMQALYNVGFARWDEVWRLNRASLAALRDAGDPQNAEHHLCSLANAEFYVGEFEASRAHFEELLHSARARRNLQHEAWGLYASCKGMVAQGKLAESRPRLDEAKALLDQLSDAASQIIVQGLYTLVALRGGDLAAARAHADDASRRIRNSRAAVYSTIVGYAGRAEGYLELADRRAGDVGELLELGRAACADLKKLAIIFPFASPAAQRYHAQWLALTGRSAAAARAFERAIATSRGMGMPFDEAQALWLASRYVDAQRDARRTAAGHLFARLGCAWHLDQIKE